MVRLERRAKYLLAQLSSGDTLVMHLGMSGSFRIEPHAGRRRRTRSTAPAIATTTSFSTCHPARR